MLRYYNICILKYYTIRRFFFRFENGNASVRVADRRSGRQHVECVRVSGISVHYQIPLIGN